MTDYNMNKYFEIIKNLLEENKKLIIKNNILEKHIINNEINNDTNNEINNDTNNDNNNEINNIRTEKEKEMNRIRQRIFYYKNRDKILVYKKNKTLKKKQTKKISSNIKPIVNSNINSNIDYSNFYMNIDLDSDILFKPL